MPKKKVEGEPDYPKIQQFTFEDGYQESSVVKVWCDGRSYDPETETYRPQYSYSITSPKWSYDGNDIMGAANELPDLYKASQSLFAFLYASQESYERHLRGAFTDGNWEMFPQHVNNWAVHYNEEISNYSLACQAKVELS